MNTFDETATYDKFRLFPFFRDWERGRLSRKLFSENMEMFKADFTKEGISEDAYNWVYKRELSK